MAVLITKAGAGLTKREQEVMKWIARGCSNKQIAGKLFISEETVKKHVRNIFSKLSVTNRIAALRKAGML
jgi:two-component system nitrate/nitrite response regulator NarP